jgi:hypothetical protein
MPGYRPPAHANDRWAPDFPFCMIEPRLWRPVDRILLLLLILLFLLFLILIFLLILLFFQNEP